MILLGFFRKRRIEKYTEDARAYLQTVNRREAEMSATEYTEKKAESEMPTPRRTYASDCISHQYKREIKYSDRSGASDDRYNGNAELSALDTEDIFERADKISRDIEALLSQTFVDALAMHISRRGMRDSEVYKAAGIDRRLFSKIMSDRKYKPSKDTAIALALAVRLTSDEADELLSRSGYVLSHSIKRDVIIEYFFCKGIYRLDDINEVLYALGERTLGR